MKKLLFALALVCIIGYFLITLFAGQQLNAVKQNTLTQNPNITGIENVSSNGGWGEWFSEYVMIVDIGGIKYRIWTNELGDIVDEEVL